MPTKKKKQQPGQPARNGRGPKLTGPPPGTPGRLKIIVESTYTCENESAVEVEPGWVLAQIQSLHATNLLHFDGECLYQVRPGEPAAIIGRVVADGTLDDENVVTQIRPFA